MFIVAVALVALVAAAAAAADAAADECIKRKKLVCVVHESGRWAW